MFNLEEVPFSRYGSYISISKLPGKSKILKIEDGLYLRTIHGDANKNDVFKIDPVDKEGNLLKYRTNVSPEVLTLETDSGSIKFCIAEPEIVHVKGEKIGLRLYTENTRTTVPDKNNNWIINCSENLIQFLLKSLKGELKINAAWEGEQEYTEVLIFPEQKSQEFDLILNEFLRDQPDKDYDMNFEEAVENVKEDFISYLNRMPAGSEELEEARELASYVNWSCVVAPGRQLNRPAMLMSKNWMTNVWSWDHCFNAIALSYNYPELAWDQFMILFDFQSEKGKLPDKVNDSFSTWHSTKPPIHGWALKKMMDNTDYIGEDELQEVYEPLCRWTEWWLEYRDEDQDGIPEYHHGNDSGWDNSTVFIKSPPVESPDLPAFLIIQMEVLAEIAEKINETRDAKKWKGHSRDLLDKLLAHSLKDGKLQALTSGDHQIINSESLLPYISIVLANRLPEDIKNKLIEGIKDFITEYGPATEKVDSDYYDPDGYWRGPIWAPSTMLLVDGLLASGEKELAFAIAEKFTRLCSENGFAENFNALTGKGLRDRAYTWTASVYLILAHEYTHQG